MGKKSAAKKEGRQLLLDKIQSPIDLRALPALEMPALCEEIRAFLVENVTKTGGHLASNLGVVELSVALHRVFDTPRDRVIFDVGHQSYVHKMLTGRRGQFPSLREPGGLSGFTNRRESEYDPFGAGHSSTALSAALGFAQAERLRGKDAYTVAVIGDGAFTGGMVHEALNNIDRDLPLIVVLNENEMSISRNTGAFARYIARMRASHGYLTAKERLSWLLERLPLIGQPIYRALQWAKEKTKKRLLRGNYFEGLGFLYLGPIDGNDYARVERVLRQAKRRKGAVLVHIKTEKGHGYEPAVRDPQAYHHVGAGSAGSVGNAGNTRGAAARGEGARFPSVLGAELTERAKGDDRICAITAATGFGCGLDPFAKAYPSRFFDVGIAEEHAVTFAAGLAANGMLPCFAVYSSFLQRAYDNVLHDVALQDLPVKLFIDRAGLAMADGATHHGIFDVSFLSSIPNMHIFAPACIGSLRAAVGTALALPHPTAVRYPNAVQDERVERTFYPNGDFDSFGVRADFVPGQAPRNVVVAFGCAVSRALDATEAARARGLSCGVVLIEALKPYDTCAQALRPYLTGATRVIFFEEGIESGGAAASLLLHLREKDTSSTFDARVLAIRDHFVAPNEVCDLYRFAGVSAQDILAALVE